MGVDLSNPLLELRGLKTYFHTEEGIVRAVDDVSFSMNRGEVLGLVGESGCGKSVTSYSIMQLLPMPPGRFEGGEVVFKGQNLLDLKDSQMRKIRGNEIGMIFQEPMTALNPVVRVGKQVEEALALHTDLGKEGLKARAVDLLDKVGIPEPARRAESYPHELSGGMRQRIMIAMALSCSPDLLIADEPTTALDVTIQAQILELIRDMQAVTGSAMILITHDLAVIAETVDRVAVMYAGKIVEITDVKEIFSNPAHPYTQGLLRSIPVLGEPGKSLKAIPGRVPGLIDLPEGCAFANRCDFAGPRCTSEHPVLKSIKQGHDVRCHIHDKGVE